ncbi:MAG: tubulin-like doman-containing protein [Aquabacterium sp.]|nr:tubulin-like doman-containing protein [Aquabacterium sp.]
MSSTAGIDLMRGRPTPAIGSTEAKLQQRKLDALKRGVHRIADISALPFGVHLIGVGGAGVRVVEQFLRDAPDDLLSVPGSRLTALALDIGDQDLAGVRALAGRFGPAQAQVEAVALDLPEQHSLQDSLSRYRDFLKLEYPMYHANPDAGAWLPTPAAGGWAAGKPLSRAVAKAAYGRAWYDGDRPMAAALKRFARSVEATQGDAVVCLVFGLAGGTGSGMALDLARHLSNGLFGRRVLLTGIGIAPHADDSARHPSANLFPVLAELDALCDDDKNRGVTLSCGDLYKNPFTAGFVVVPQPAGADVTSTRTAVNRELAAFLLQRRGANLWEALRLLNWVAAPSTQHSAARTPWGARWIHLFGFGSGDTAPGGVDVRAALGLLPGYAPEFIELRTAEGNSDAAATGWTHALDDALQPEVPTHLVTGGLPGSVQFLLPRLAKTDLALFHHARAAYDALPTAQRPALHALLLEQGVVLCEPSRRLPGMAGASLGDGGHWVAVPLDALRGEPA